MFKTLAATLIVLVLCAVSIAQNGDAPETTSLQVIEDYQSVIDQANETRKPVFIYVYDSV